MTSANVSNPTSSASGSMGSAHSPFDVDHVSADLARNWWVVALRGGAGILFGIIALVMPGATMLSLVLVFAAYLLVDGVLGIVSAVRAARQHNKWGWLTFDGIVNIVTAVLMVLWPAAAVITFVLLVAAWALLSGGLMLGAAFRLRRDYGRGWLIFGGIVSIIYGVLLIVAPVIGALVLTWWLGAYALVFGAALLVLGFKLRARRHDRAQVLPQAAT
jgi:uncharacterized membrane protein HdeD (DUF308 family)